MYLCIKLIIIYIKIGLWLITFKCGFHRGKQPAPGEKKSNSKSRGFFSFCHAEHIWAQSVTPLCFFNIYNYLRWEKYIQRFWTDTTDTENIFIFKTVCMYERNSPHLLKLHTSKLHPYLPTISTEHYLLPRILLNKWQCSLKQSELRISPVICKIKHYIKTLTVKHQ